MGNTDEADVVDAITSDIEDTGVYATAQLRDVSSGRRQAVLMCLSGRCIGQVYPLTASEITVGRSPESDVCIDDEGVSRHHAKLVLRGVDGSRSRSERVGGTLHAHDGKYRWLLVDVGSTNGSFHRGERVDVLTLEDGDQIHLGAGTVLQFRFQDEREAEFHQLMRTYTTQDPLTKALNRRAFEVELEKEVGYARRHGEPLALIMFDVDHFKRINDAYGHVVGDHVLSSIAEAVQDIKRKEDTFARFGGEEFVILLRATDEAGAGLFADRVRRAVEGLGVQSDKGPVHCTISVGVALLSEVDEPSALVELADRRLYAAKAQGRNRLVGAVTNNHTSLLED